MKNTTLKIIFGILIFGLATTSAFAQGRGRGHGRGPNLDRKCNVFVNCHDARDGRRDGRGPRTSVNNIFSSRGSRVGDRRRYNTNDYWQRRHVTDARSWRYRNRNWRDR
jgi:hypothetical protein